MLDKFWQCVSESRCVTIDASVIDWLGYDSKQDRDNKATFLKLLKSHNIDFSEIKHSDKNFSKYPKLVKEAESLTKEALKRKQWIIMDSDDFKMMVMCLKTKKAMDIRRYYLAIEKLFKMFCEYTLHFNLRREERLLKEKDNVIKEKDCKIEALMQKILEVSTETKEELKGVRGELGQANDQLGQANAKLDDANEQLEVANERIETVEERMGVMEEHIEEIRDVAVPKPRNKGKIHKIGLVKMSPRYVPDPSDPGYVRNSNVVIIRRQQDSFNVRVQQIKNYGNETNANARVIFETDNPNSINLFNRLKEKRDPKLGFNGVCGIRYLNGCTDEHLLQLISEIHDVRLEM